MILQQLFEAGPGGSDNYAENLAQMVFNVRPKLTSEDDVLNIGHKVATQDLMSQVRANYLFARDQDFPSDFVSAYYHLQKQGVAEGLNEFAQGDFNGGDDSNDLQLYLNVAKKLNMKKYKPSTAHNLIAKKMAELVDVVDDDKVDYARHMARKAQGLPNMLEQGVAEGSQRVDSLVTDALKIMRGSEVSDAVQALKTVLGDREYNSRRGHYNFYVRQLMDMYGQQGVAEGLNEFAPVGGDDREPNEEEILRQLAAMWWLGTEQQMAKAQSTLAAMGWEIGQDESGDDDAGVFVIRSGDVNGDSYLAFNHSDLEELNEAFNNYHANRTGFTRGARDPEGQDPAPDTRTWYIRLNGKLIRDKAGNPYSFRDKAAANKAALTMQAKLFNQGKEFMLTTNPNDKSQGVAEEKVRLDPKCWTGKKIGNPKTKVKGGVRVNNCVPAESVEEAANAAQQAAIAIAMKKAGKKPKNANEDADLSESKISYKPKHRRL